MINSAERTFLLRRLHSLTGIVPIGGFLLFHFFENASARNGAAAFNETVVKISEMPYLVFLEWGALLLPILFHSVYGLFITASAKPNVVSHSYARNWAYFFQRATGIIAFAYLVMHISTTRLWAILVKGDHITFTDMADRLNQPFFLWFYIVGIIAITYHFANGLWSFSVTWGLVRTEAGQKRLALLTMGFFAVLCLVGLDILSAFLIDGGFISRLINV